MWDILYKAAHQSKFFLGEILISEAKRREDEVRSGGTVFFIGKYIGMITKSGKYRQSYLSDLRNETRYYWVKQGEMLQWDKLYKKIR